MNYSGIRDVTIIGKATIHAKNSLYKARKIEHVMRNKSFTSVNAMIVNPKRFLRSQGKAFRIGDQRLPVL